MEEAIFQEVKEYAARRMGGRTPRALALAQKAARAYVATFNHLHRNGADHHFWERMQDLSDALDTILHSFPGDADYYMGPRQYDELILPALKATRRGPRMPPLSSQVSLVGDLVIHCHCQAMNAAQQSAGVVELARILGNARRHEPKDLYDVIAFCSVSAVSKLVFMATDRARRTDGHRRAYSAEVAVEAARLGFLKAALEAVARPLDTLAAMGVRTHQDKDESELHFVYMAQVMTGCLLAQRDFSFAATVGSWAATQPLLVGELLRKLQRPLPTHDDARMVMITLRLALQLAAASPPMLEALQAAGLQAQLGRLMSELRDPQLKEEVSGWVEVLELPTPEMRRTMAGMHQIASNLGTQMGVADYAAFVANAAHDATGGGAAGRPGSSQAQQAQQPQPQARPCAGPPLSRAEIAALPVRELKQRLAAAGVDSSRCVGKEELVDLLADAQAKAVGGAATAGEPGRSTSSNGQAASRQPLQTEGARQGEEAGGEPAKRCACCGATKATGVKLRLCSGCRTPGFYLCSVACQKQLWPGHKAACKAAQQQQQQEQGEQR